jgi:hypothetical protein
MSRRPDEHPPKEAARLIREAGRLGIPWQTILEAEIRAERLLGGLQEERDGDPPLETFLAVLPHTALESFRIRNLIERLFWKAQPGSGDGREARRELRTLGRWLLRGLPAPAAAAMAGHLLVAYRRVRELLAICRAAARARGATEGRVERVCSQTRCTAGDARWAIERAEGSRNPALEDCLRKAREEGFEIPAGRTAPETLLRLRDHLERRGLLRRSFGRRASRQSTGPSDPTD